MSPVADLSPVPTATGLSAVDVGLKVGPAGSGGGREAAPPDRIGLPCLNSHNGDGTEVLDRLNELQGSHRKTAFALTYNVKSFVEKHGLQCVGFVTLTFPDHVVDPKVCTQRFKSFAKCWLSPRPWIAVRERTKRGRLHLHLLVAFDSDIRTGSDFEAFARGSYTTANFALRKLWASLRAAAPKYGFGRTEILPIKSNVEGVSKYVGKYIAKNIEGRKQCDAGARLVSYSRGSSLAKPNQFAWNSPRAWCWRQKVKQVAEDYGIEDLSGFKEKFGSHWAWSIFERVVDRRLSFYPSGVHALADGHEVPRDAVEVEVTTHKDRSYYESNLDEWLRELCYADSAARAVRTKEAWSRLKDAYPDQLSYLGSTPVLIDVGEDGGAEAPSMPACVQSRLPSVGRSSTLGALDAPSGRALRPSQRNEQHNPPI